MSQPFSGAFETLPSALTTDPRILRATEAAGVALWSYCPKTHAYWASTTWYRLLGYQPDEGDPSLEWWFRRMHPEDAGDARRALEALLDGRSTTYKVDVRLRAVDGSWRWIGAFGGTIPNPGGEWDIVYGMAMDISDRKVTEQMLAETAKLADQHRRRLTRLAENSPAALFEFRMDAEGQISLPFSTIGVHHLLAVPPDEVAEDGLVIFRNIFEEDLAAMGPVIETSRAELSPFKFRYRVHRRDLATGYIWVQANSAPVREDDGGTVWFGSIHDITSEVEQELILAGAHDSMRHLALHDSLTGLPNRRHLDDVLHDRAETQAGEDLPAVLLRIDLDRFKYVNDSLGHPAGDAVLCHVAKILDVATAPEDLCSRVGGDEFCVLLGKGKTVGDAERIVDAITDRLTSPFFFEGKVCRFGASFGIATSAHGDIVNGDLMSFADAALYEAKAKGRGQLEIFSKDLHEGILENRRLASDLESAIERRDFEPFFQPQVCAQSGDLIGAEVLARWRTLDGAIIPPAKFVPVAEQIRAVPLIDRIIMERTAELIEAWAQDDFLPPKVSFNVSAGRLHDTSLVHSVRGIQRRGVTVAFELLESILLEEDSGVGLMNLDLARDAGISVEIDDFGTGHASILGVLEARPDVLKIDRRLTANVVETVQARELIASIIGIARSLGIRTTAEGVETRAQADVLRELGCNVFQGYLYAKPLPSADLLAWVRAYGAPAPARAGTKVATLGQRVAGRSV